MEPFDPRLLPFVTRDMLAFSGQAQFNLNLNIVAVASGDLQVRGATRDGIFVFNVSVAQTTSQQDFSFPVADVPLWVSVTDANNNYARGECFASLGLTINGDLMHQLARGDVYRLHGLSFPSSNLKNSAGEQGNLKIVSFPTTAAGSDLDEETPTNEVWRILAITLELTTSATVANRQLVFDVRPGGSAMYRFISNTVQTAGTTRTYRLMPVGDGATYSLGEDIIVPIPNYIVVPEASSVRTAIVNLQAGDDIGEVNVYREQWIGTE